MAQAPFTIIPRLVAIANNYSAINMVARGYVADQVAPRVRVDGPLFRWWGSNLAEAFTVPDNQIGRLGRANEITQTSTEQAGATIDYALREPVPYRDQAAANGQSVPMSLLEQATRNVLDKNQLAREVRVAALAMTPANYSPGYVTDLSAGTKWSDFSNSDPVAAMIDAMQTMLLPGSVGITSQRVFNVIRRHPAFAKALGGTYNSGRYASADEMASILGLSKIIVGNTLKQTSKRGQALVTGNVWPDSFAIHYQGVTGADGMLMDSASPNFLTTFQWGDQVAGTEEVAPGEMGLWGGKKVLQGESIVEKQVAPYAGYLFNSVL